MDMLKALLQKMTFNTINAIIGFISGLITIVQLILVYLQQYALVTIGYHIISILALLLVIVLFFRTIKHLRVPIETITTDSKYNFYKTTIVETVVLIMLAITLTVSRFIMPPAKGGTLSANEFHNWIVKDNLNQTITDISIQSTLKGAMSDAIDLSEERDGSVLGWKKGNTLYLAGNKGIAAPEDCSYLFSFNEAYADEQKRWSKLKQVRGASNFKTENTKNMGFMFYYCTALESIDVSEWDTLLVKDMGWMFCGCKSLKNLNVGAWNTSLVEKMTSLFDGCSSLSNLNVSKWDTSSVINMGWMFWSCESLTSLDVSDFKTGNVVNMHAMFANCKQLEALDVSEWDTSNVGVVPEDKSDDKSFTGGMSFMFENCSSLVTLGETDVKNWILSDNVNTYRMFIGTRWEKDPPIHSPGTLSKEKLTEWASKETTRRNSIEKVVFVDNLDEAPADAMDFSEEKDRGVLGWFSDGTLYIAGSKRIIAPKDCSYLFSDKTAYSDNYAKWGNLKLIENANILDTSNVENMYKMFYLCEALKEIDVSDFNTANVKTMRSMFSGCQSLTSLGENNVRNWDTKNVIDFGYLFYNCTMLEKLDVSKWNTSFAEAMTCLFYNCKALETIDVSRWNTSSVTSTGWMFYSCESLTSLDVSSFITENVVNMKSMFCGCKNLMALEVSRWDTSNVGVVPEDKANDSDYQGGMEALFKGCSSLTSLGETGVSNWEISENVSTTEMFTGTKWEDNPPIK